MKKQAILNTARQLFFKFGIKRVTVEEICREARVSKMTFYKYFPNKKGLALSLIKQIYDDGIGKFEKLLNSEISYREKVELFIIGKLSSTEDMSNEFYREVFNEKGSPFNKCIEEYRERANLLFKNFLQKGQEEGYIRKNMDIDFVIYFTNKLPIMLEDNQLLDRYCNLKDLTSEIMNFMFYGMCER